VPEQTAPPARRLAPVVLLVFDDCRFQMIRPFARVSQFRHSVEFAVFYDGRYLLRQDVQILRNRGAEVHDVLPLLRTLSANHTRLSNAGMYGCVRFSAVPGTK